MFVLSYLILFFFFFFFSSRRRHTRCYRDWSSDVCSSDLGHSSPRRRQSPHRRVAALNRPIGPIPMAPSNVKIGRASCRKECRSRWSPYHEKKKKKKKKIND